MKEITTFINSNFVSDPFPTDIFPSSVTSEKGFFPNTHSKQKSFFDHPSAVQQPSVSIESQSVDEIFAENLYSNAELSANPDAFFVCDLGEVERQYKLFKRLLPRIQPFFAIKCNPDPMVIKTLLKLGTGFDCASKTEVQTVLDIGADPSSIIYANPCKQTSQIRYAASQEVHTMTFDNADELIKISLTNPKAKLVLRILADDSRSLMKFGIKFGASIDTVPILLRKAKELGIEVIGVSFHVGSGCFSAGAFSDAVILARKAFDIGAELGFEFSLLDVGGGFPGQNAGGITFDQIASALGPTVDALFPSHVKVIAEPGRFFVSSAYTLATSIVSKRVVTQPGCDDSFMYYINDGIYGSFNCIVFDHYKPSPKVLFRSGKYHYENQTIDAPSSNCSIWGPTCDSMDCIAKSEDGLPEMNVGDWLYFNNMGAYTNAAASQFNGFIKSKVIYTNTE